MNDKFTIVIPTMWRYKPFVRFLTDLLDNEYVSEIIIINNDSTKTPSLPSSEKLRLVDSGKNLFVNPSWNLGVRLSKTENVIILNDDLIFDLKVFKRLSEIKDPNFGLACLCPGEEFYKQPKFKDGTIDIIKWEGWSLFGFGQLMFIKKSQFVNIPYQLQLYYGDDWILENAMSNKRNVYAITNILLHTPFAVTSGEIVKTVFGTDHQTFMSLEKTWFNKYAPFLRMSNEDAKALIDQEYESAKTIPTDINEHVETLYEYASKCNHVTEMGVRTGVSTRGLLKAGKTLRSYDIIQHEDVQSLFYAASKVFDAKYFGANTLDLEIDETDMLFIDTDHTYAQLSGELALHADKVRKYLAFHDTVYHCNDLVPAIFEFLDKSKGEWTIEKHFKNNNGLTILKRRGV